MQEEILVSSADVTQAAQEPISKTMSNIYSIHFTAVSRLGERDAKHGARLFMENLFFLQPHLLELSKVVPDLSVCFKGLNSNLTRAQDQYVDQQLQHSRLWPLLLLAGKLRVLLKDVRPADVRFQVRVSDCHASRPTCGTTSPSCHHSLQNVSSINGKCAKVGVTCIKRGTEANCCPTDPCNRC
jgi:hypothetical protein